MQWPEVMFLRMKGTILWHSFGSLITVQSQRYVGTSNNSPWELYASKLQPGQLRRTFLVQPGQTLWGLRNEGGDDGVRVTKEKSDHPSSISHFLFPLVPLVKNKGMLLLVIQILILIQIQCCMLFHLVQKSVNPEEQETCDTLLNADGRKKNSSRGVETVKGSLCCCLDRWVTHCESLSWPESSLEHQQLHTIVESGTPFSFSKRLEEVIGKI